MSLPIQMVTAKELEMRGSFRFHEEFGLAVEYIDKGLIDVKPLISATIPSSGRARRSSSRTIGPSR